MKKIFYGLDIDTESIGYSVTDENYNLLSCKGQDLWGVRKIDEAETCAERRAHRTARRRGDRRKYRIDLLQELFAEEICKVDPGFFQRLNDSFFVADDKVDKQPFSLFNDTNFTDKDYYKKYPTIYHLRSALLDGEKLDVRLVYLAIHHIIKYRGHFLFYGQDFSNVLSCEGAFNKINDYLHDYQESGFDTAKLSKLEESAENNKLTQSARKKQYEEILSPTSKREKAIVALIAGYKAKLSDLFDNESYDEGEIKGIKFSDASYDDTVAPKLAGIISNDEYDVLLNVKSVYDWTILTRILQGEKCISLAMRKRYEKHKEDLKTLKAFLKEYYPDKIYKEVFSEDKGYSAYVGSVKIKNKKKSVKIIQKDEFYAIIRKALETQKELSANPTYQKIMAELAEGTFMPKQVIKDNSVIPYQINKIELDQILAKAEAYLPFLKESSCGTTTSEKIASLLTFKIDYYVGPLNDSHGQGGFSWVIRKEQGRVTPWNYQDKIDVDSSAEEFILRMTNKCTYLIGKDVLPKESILYSQYCVLNEINKR